MSNLVKHNQSLEYKAKNESVLLRNCYNSEINPIILNCAKILGIKEENVPNGTNLKCLLEFLRKYFGSYTIEEFKLAFEYVASGKIQLKKDHYNVFSANFIGHVLKSYTEYLNKNNIDNKMIEEPEHITPEENRKRNIKAQYNIINHLCDAIEKGKLSDILPTDLIYKVLSKIGLLKELDKREKIKIFEDELRKFKTVCNHSNIRFNTNYKEFLKDPYNKKNYYNNELQKKIRKNIIIEFVNDNKNTNLQAFKKECFKRLDGIYKQNR